MFSWLLSFFCVPLNFVVRIFHPSPGPVNQSGPNLTFALWIALGMLLSNLCLHPHPSQPINRPLSAHD